MRVIRVCPLAALAVVGIQALPAWSSPLTASGPTNSARMIGPPITRAAVNQAIAGGGLGPKGSAGVVIGLVRDGVTRVFAYGAAKPDSIFEIGSITKTFTGLLLAQMVEQRQVTLAEPVRKLLPSGIVTHPEGPEISLLDLLTQHSGLPFFPSNFSLSDFTSVHRRYSVHDLYAYIARRGLRRPTHPPYLYSNVGYGLLGQALANRLGASYATALAEEVTGPLRMRDTVLALSPAQQHRRLPGWPQTTWHAGALAGAGDLRSTVPDMLIYLQAELHPRHLSPAALATLDGRSLPRAIQLSQKVLARENGSLRIAFGWDYCPRTGDYSHSGMSGGYTSYAFSTEEVITRA
jgi:D-alanyl-D-alanine-carboxypeptidase/D-alanyl-D-alanine-endopeptidase